MSRLTQVAPENANTQQAELFATAKSKLGRVPNMLRAMSNSPAALRGYLDFATAAGAGDGLNAHQREIVALTVGEANGCEYCVAAHSAIGKMVGLSPEAINAARRVDGVDESGRAVARFAEAVLESRGRVTDAELEAFRDAGFDEAAIADVVANVALNVYTNYFNNLAETDLDFPAAAPLVDTQSEVAEEVACTTSCGCGV